MARDATDEDQVRVDDGCLGVFGAVGGEVVESGEELVGLFRGVDSRTAPDLLDRVSSDFKARYDTYSVMFVSMTVLS